MKRFLATALMVVVLASVTYNLTYGHNQLPVLAAPASPENILNDEEEQVRLAIEQALAASESYMLSAIPNLIQVTNIDISSDGQWATAWLVLSNPQTGEPLPSEPGLAVAKWDGNQWIVSLPSDPTYDTALISTPSELLAPGAKTKLLSIDRLYAESAPAGPFSGYLLPWRAGETVFLSRSVAHDADITSGNAHYSFDFYISKTMFDIHAARSGTVFIWRDDVPNDTHDRVNYIVLEDTTTTPTTYQLYLHLAQNSIPSSLKQIGAPVAQGQYIGIADNTGASTGHHLHFQVESDPFWDSYWGRSLDIVFDDVNINGGRPRVEWDNPYCTWAGDVCNEFQSAYISTNLPPGDLSAPRGDITNPDNGITVEKRTITLQGWATDDDSGLDYARFKANYDGSWVPIGPLFTDSPFSFEWDLCSGVIPDGPVSVYLEMRDKDGNLAPGLPGLRHFLKNYPCPTPPPACNPSPDQVALYADPDFRGSCTIFSHNGAVTLESNLGSLGNNNAASVQVGSDVLATLYMNTDGSGRGETFSHSDAHLSDNRIGNDTVSSIIVQPKTSLPAIPKPTWPGNTAAFPGNASISLVWDDRGGANEFQVELNGEQKPWQIGNVLHLGSLSAGTYLWKVRARNSSGTSSWSSLQSLIINPNSTTPSAVSAPYTDNMESGYSGWENSSYWDQTNTENHTTSGFTSWMYDTNTTGYDTGEPNTGDLTTPSITIPESGYYLRFWYRYETESPGTQWDQRWVQLSVDGGLFTNLLQLYDDPPNTWLNSPAIDLSTYAGSTIQVRFHFETLDAELNTNKGWYIDDFTIDKIPPPQCNSPNEPDNSTTLARTITYNNDYSGEICPGGDKDYFKFSGNSGDHLGASSLAKQIGSDLDTYLFLLDMDGQSVLTENDDLIYGVQTDSQFNYVLSRTGTYFLKLRAWNNPTAGGPTYTYRLGLYHDGADPDATFTHPPGGTFLPTSSVSLEVEASDSQSEISHVDFYWHSGDWKNTGWNYIGSDSDVEAGWKYEFVTSSISDQKDIAFLAQVYDQAGNRRDVAIWNMAIDHTPPSSALAALPDSNSSTVIPLYWSGSDNLSGIDHFELQARQDDGYWEDWLTNINQDRQQAWVIVDTGHNYQFRLRAVDRVGNIETYPLLAESATHVPLTVCAGPDGWENDNTKNTASLIDEVMITQVHNFCNPQSGSDWQEDEDWYKINLKSGSSWQVQVIPLNGSAPAILRLFDQDDNLLTEALEADFGQINGLEWFAKDDQMVYLQIKPVDDRVTGDDARYQFASRRVTIHFCR